MPVNASVRRTGKPASSRAHRELERGQGESGERGFECLYRPNISCA